MSTIQDFILQNVGKPNTTPKALIMKAYEMGLAHGKGEEYNAPELEEGEEEVVEEEGSKEEGEEEEGEEEEEDGLLFTKDG